ncbi:MAG: hypothetical protein PHX74_12425 [Candidatus Sumerlaeales bacterium]|nr:hypothetical protein [Candidatus Sumerlaeales bacterium]
MKNSKTSLTIVLLLAVTLILSGCTQADKVSSNISKEADLFNVTRRLAVMNMRTDKPIFEMIGNFSLGNNDTNELTITVQTGPSQYKKHFIYLNDWTMYVVEDISGANVSPYKYEINFMPESIIPITFTNSY